MRPYSLPPETPKDRIAILRRAFTETLKDPDFLGEAKKSGLEIDPVSAQKIERIFVGLYEVKTSTLDKLKKIL